MFSLFFVSHRLGIRFNSLHKLNSNGSSMGNPGQQRVVDTLVMQMRVGFLDMQGQLDTLAAWL